MKKRIWPFTQILLLGSIVITLIAVVVTIAITNITLRSVEKNLPITLFDELASLDQALEHISDVVMSSQVAVENPSSQNLNRLKENVTLASNSIETLRRTYVFDNLIRASAFHAIVAPAISDLQIWLTEGISGYNPDSLTTISIALSRITTVYQKARDLNLQSRLHAKQKLADERDRLDRFLNSVNLLFLLTLLVTFFMIVLFIRQHLFKLRETKAQNALQTQSDLLNSLLENIPLGIMVWSDDDRIQYVNDTFIHLTGYLTDDIEGVNHWYERAYPDPDYRKEVFEEWQKAKASNHPQREFKITCKDGQVKDMELRGSYLPDGRSLITFADITERKLDEKRLHYFKTAVEFSSDAIGMADPEGRHWYQNKSFDLLFGDIEKELPANLFVDEQLGKQIVNTIKQGGQWFGEAEMYGKNGSILNILLRSYAIRNHKGQIIGLVGTHTDVSRQKQAEKDMRISEQKYRAVVENTPDLLYRTDATGVITFISASVYQLSGYTVEEAVGLKMAEEVYAIPEERAAFLDELRKYGRVKNFQARLKRKDGTIWWASTNAHFLKDEEGNVIGVEGITRDITETKMAEAALRESEQRLRAILEASPDPMVMYNNEGLPLFVNPTFTEVFGWRIDELEKHSMPFYPEDKRLENIKRIRETFESGQSVKFETKWYTKDDRVLDVLLSGAVTVDNNGDVTGIVINLTDVTEKKALETQYEQAQKMESLGTLAGGIAHDFNNLLSGIFGYLDIARRRTKDQKIVEYLSKAINASGRAEGLTHQLLTFSKGGAPVKKIEPLVPFLQETAQFALSGSNITCQYDLQEDLWSCDYDKNQIGQVIDNIIINALQAMPSGGIIRISASNITIDENELAGMKKGDYVKLTISDTGMGIPEKYLSRIFDPFFTTKQTGSGLGLATSYSIIKKHNGRITVESVQGNGTSFQLLLPAARKKKSMKESVYTQIYQGSGKILIMDDDELLQRMLVDMLDDMGFTSQTTANGQQALEAFNRSLEQQEPFQAVILDLTIRGGMGGKETVKEIRKLDAKIPIFVSSGYSEDDAIANPHLFGFTDSLKKPFGLEQLTKVLQQYL